MTLIKIIVNKHVTLANRIIHFTEFKCETETAWLEGDTEAKYESK